MREELGIESGVPLLDQVAQITPWKAQDTSIRWRASTRRVQRPPADRRQHRLLGKGCALRHRVPAVLLFGSLQDRVHFLGQRGDVPGILRELDLSLLPSWDSRSPT